MDLDTGLIVVILAVLVFYLRLIILQRQRVKRVNQARALEVKDGQGKKKKGAAKTSAQAPNYSVLSPDCRDRAIGVAGLVLIILGVFLYSALNPWQAAQPYWWIPTAVGIVAFSWLFRLGPLP